MNKLQHIYNTLKLNKSIRLLHTHYYNYETNTDTHQRNYVLKYITPGLYQAVLKKEHILFDTVKLIDFKILSFDQNEPTRVFVRYKHQDKIKKTMLIVPSFKHTMKQLKMMKYQNQLKKRGKKYGY